MTKHNIPLLLAAAITPLASCYAAQTPERPNILFCIADDATFYHFSAVGCSWVNTPNFDRVADNGILFRNCYTPNAKSGPSRACVLTGLNSWQLGEVGNHVAKFPADQKTFTDILAEGGYEVAYTGKGWAPGDPGLVDGEPRRLTGTPFQKKKVKAPTKGISNCDYSGNFQSFLEQSTKDQPWFFWFGCQEPHRRYEYGSGAKVGGKSVDMIDEVPPFWPDNDVVRNDMLDYAYEIEYFDSQLGRMIDMLEQRGELDNTIIVITADNGMPFPRSKANNYEFSNHMPLAIMWGDGIKKAGREVLDYISFVDFAPTFLDIANIDAKDSGMRPFAGRSLKPIFTTSKEGFIEKERESMLLGRERDDYGRPNNQGYPIRSIIRDGIMYLTNLKPNLYPMGNPETGYLDIDGSPTKSQILDLSRANIDQQYYLLSMEKRPLEEMYDIRNDKYCMNNIIDNPDYAQIKESLREELLCRLKEQNDPRMGENGDIFDSYEFDSSDKWNFYERVVSGEIKEPWNQTKWINPTDYQQYKPSK